jgi:gluconokinase
MANDQPLTDADRWDWLITLRNESVKALANTSGVIVTCSALKRKYRDVMRIASYHKPEIRVHFVFLAASESALLDRVRARKNHYMKDSMVHSQFESLETPTEDEVDVLKVDASGNVEHVKNLALDVVHKVMVEDA